MAGPDLADLDAFAAVARTRSFRRAAGLRGVSASSLSEAVRRLETVLGVRLLNRTTRSVTPTEAGERLLERLGPALGEVAAAVDAVNSFRDSPAGTLRLNVPTVVARMILPPLLEAFLRRHPGIRMEVVSDDSFIDVLAAGFDAGVRYDERLERDMIAVPIGPRVQRFVAAASPDYLAARGVPRHPRDLLGHDCIEKDGRVVKIAPEGRLVAGNAELEIFLAARGFGVVKLFEEYLAPHLASGTLVPVLEDWSQRFSGPFLYYPARRHMPAPLRAFVDFLRQRDRPDSA
jgi:DNA-binding transcriptional LysR family regulator